MARILGIGGYVPERVMTNDDWATIVDTTDEWITTRTGIKERRFAADDESTLDLCANAAEQALESAGLTAAEINARAEAWIETTLARLRGTAAPGEGAADAAARSPRPAAGTRPA